MIKAMSFITITIMLKGIIITDLLAEDCITRIIRTVETRLGSNF